LGWNDERRAGSSRSVKIEREATDSRGVKASDDATAEVDLVPKQLPESKHA
jgi:hypothetical protein